MLSVHVSIMLDPSAVNFVLLLFPFRPQLPPAPRRGESPPDPKLGLFSQLPADIKPLVHPYLTTHFTLEKQAGKQDQREEAPEGISLT